MDIKELKQLNKKELALWTSKVKATELKAILKTEGIKGYSKYKKSELLETVLDMVISSDDSEVINDDVKTIYEETKALTGEINARQSFEEKFEDTLIARYQAGEITYQQLIDVVSTYKISNIPVVYGDKETQDWYFDRGDFYSQYEHLDKDSKKYYAIFSKEFTWDSQCNYWRIYNYYDCIDEYFHKHNRVVENDLALAYEYDDDSNLNLLIYKDCELLGAYTDGQIDDIKALSKYDKTITGDDIKVYEKLLDKLNERYEEYQDYSNKEWAKRQKESARKRNYDKAYKLWKDNFWLYASDKYSFEDIWDNAGEIKNRAKYYEMQEYVTDKKRNAYKQYEDMFSGIGTKTVAVKEEDKSIYKTIYRSASLKLHPDVLKDGGHAMQVLNQLKESWGI